MHIVFLIHHIPVKSGLAAGGAGNYVLNMAKVLKQNGHDVDIVTEGQKNNLIVVDEINIFNVIIDDATKPKRLTIREKLIKNLKRSYLYNKKVNEIDRRNHIDIVQCVSTYGIGLLRTRKIPYLIRMSDYLPLWNASNDEDFVYENAIKKCRLDEYTQLLALKRADRVISPSYFMEGILKEKLGINSRVIESPILIDSKKEYVFKELFDKGDYILTFGAISRRKEMHILIPIVDKILDKYPNLKFVLIGKGLGIRENDHYISIEDYSEKYIKRNKDRFIYLGEMNDRDRLFSIIQNARICVLPTRMDNLPNTVLEAMALGKVIVSSTSYYGTSVEQLITDGENGLLANIDDEKSLLEKIEQAMELTDLEKQAMEFKAKKRVESLTPENVYEEMMKEYRDTISEFNRDNM